MTPSQDEFAHPPDQAHRPPAARPPAPPAPASNPPRFMTQSENESANPHEEAKGPPAAGAASVRGGYEAHGVAAYYRRFGAAYRNPHEPAVRRTLRAAVAAWRPDLSRVLDLAAGSGEATLALRELGAAEVDGIDPYTAAAYEARTGRPAAALSFEDVAVGALAARPAYSLVVCSFALHLCEPSRLPGVAAALALVSPALLVVTPHKRPVIG